MLLVFVVVNDTAVWRMFMVTVSRWGVFDVRRCVVIRGKGMQLKVRQVTIGIADREREEGCVKWRGWRVMGALVTIMVLVAPIW